MKLSILALRVRETWEVGQWGGNLGSWGNGLLYRGEKCEKHTHYVQLTPKCGNTEQHTTKPVQIVWQVPKISPVLIIFITPVEPPI